METDSVTSLRALVKVGACASIVPHTWLHAMPMGDGMRAIRLVDPEARAQVLVAVHAGTPGSVIGRAFLDAATGLSLDDVFTRSLPIEGDGS
jgi:DNA-binding transcriptional LysR family regulator